MSETGRPVYKASMSEGIAVGDPHQVQLKVLQSKITELELRNTELQRQLNPQHEAVGGGEPPREDGSLEQAYTRREYVDHLVSEVKRLEPLEKEVEKLQRQLKHMDEVCANAQKRDQQLCDQVALVSLKEAEITELKRQLSAARENQQVSGSKVGALELAKIARLKEELTSKEHEIARTRARLKNLEKKKSAEGDSTGTPPPTAGDIAAMQADYERKLQHKETMISRLKERVTALTEAAQQSGQGDGDSEDMEKLRRAVKERDEKIKKLSSKLQSFMKTAAEVEKIVKHSKDQSGEIARLKKQLEVAETEKSDDLSGLSSENEALQRKLNESLTTVRRLHLQTKKLEDENKALKDGAHMFANTKMAEIKRENASLKEKAKEREEAIAAMGLNLEVLSRQKVAYEEQNRSLTEANKHLKDFSHHLEQKVIGQQASIQNIMQDLQVTKKCASEAAMTLERCKQWNSELQKQCQDLQAEKEAMQNAYQKVQQEHQQLLMEHRQFQQERQRNQLKYEQEQQQQERLQYAEVRATNAERQLHEIQSQWIIPRSEIELSEEELGRGSWAKVKVAKFRGTHVAAKCYYKVLISEHNLRQFRREISMAARLRHPNLVQSIGASIEGELILVTELMTTSLGDLMHRGPLSEANITSISLDVAQALNYLHLMQPHPIIHRDICSGNVLLNPLPEDCWKAKVSDYGSINLLEYLTTAHPGNPFYSAPESEYPRLQTAKMDIYSFGVLLAEMLTNELPEKKDRHEQILKISVERPTFIKLVRQCLNEESVHRPSAQEMITTFLQLRMR